MLFAHSPKGALGIPAQTYKDHTINVINRAACNAEDAAGSMPFAPLFTEAVRVAAEYHDLGKLDPLNQDVLARDGSGRLPINHVDAGVAAMLRRRSSKPAAIAAALIYSHHHGLPNFSELLQNECRDIAIDERFGSVKQRTDQWLDRYVEMHNNELSFLKSNNNAQGKTPTCMQLLYRIGLSCLVDADHTDTSANYGQPTATSKTTLRPVERIKRLDEYITRLGESNSERNQLRAGVYTSCRDSAVVRGLVSCDSPVGSGKTTAVMAHLLGIAAKYGMRRVFVVLPYTNIITQSVEVYRKSLALPGEEPEHVIAAHHHRAEFSNPLLRHLTYQWEAPIVVTTAVQFFETLASARTGALRKFHQLANSAIFIDESHAALPAHLWPAAWRWLSKLHEEWNCHFVLGSGSLSKFWTLPEFANPPTELPSIVSTSPQQASNTYESSRIHYCTDPEPKTLETLVEWVGGFEGPRLLIVNTVQSAAYIASKLQETHGRKSVEHLSTSLTPLDRERSLARVKKRLNNTSDRNWTLVATSCVEAGVDISFRSGFRERASLNSLLQTSGRVNRSGEFGTANVWDFQLLFDHRLRPHPSFEDSAAVLRELFSERKVAPDHCTEAMRREIRRGGMNSAAQLIERAELKKQFVEVEEMFKVIDSNTVVAIVQKSLIRRLRNLEKVSFQELQNGSVQIYSNRISKLALEPLTERAGIYLWTLQYNSFIGYMAGVIEDSEFINSGGAFV